MTGGQTNTADGGVIDTTTDAAGEATVGSQGACKADMDCAAGTVCSMGMCVPGCSAAQRCPAEESCCNGQCVDTKTDVNHCGGCSACAITNGSGACTNGACTVASCSPGFVDCDGKAANGCELTKPVGPSVPSPTRPVAGDYTGSFRADSALNTLRPTFKWTASTPDTCGTVNYQIQLDDSCKAGTLEACAFASPEVDTTVTTNSFQPATALAVQKTQPVGTRYYWRVRACDSAKVCSEWSTVRYVDVGRVRDDLNGDGYADLLVRGGSDNLYIYFGGNPPTNQVAVHGKPGSSFAFAGDLDGDGYGDLIVGDPTVVNGGGSFGGILVYSGKATWNAELAEHETIYHSADGTSGFPSAVSSAGDLNGDGHADIMASRGTSGSSAISIYVDPAGHFASPRTVDLSQSDTPLEDGFGRAGDLDGDGLGDVAVLSGTGAGNTFEIFRGSADPMSQPVRHQTFVGSSMRIMRPAGDLDGDGCDDLVFAGFKGDLEQSTLATVRGAHSFENAAGGAIVYRTFTDSSVAFRGLAAGGDTNKDGLPDVYWTAVEGYALLSIAGNAGWSAQSPATNVDASSTGSNYGSALAMADYDGDGIADLAVASALPGLLTATGAVSIRLAKGTVVNLTAPSMAGLGAALGH